MRWFVPRELGEVMEPGTAATSRLARNAASAVEKVPLGRPASTIEHERGKPRDDAVSPHEGRAQRLGTPRIFGDDSTLGIYDTLEQFTAAFGIGHVSTRAKDDDRRAAAIERRAMRALVTSHRATGDDGNAARGDVRGEHLGAGKTIGRRLAGPDDGDARLQCRRIADAAKHTRRIGRIAQYGRIFDRSDVDLEARAV